MEIIEPMTKQLRAKQAMKVLPYNLKATITNCCPFEPNANPTYAEIATHYNAVIIPARSRAPQDKSIVENAVLMASHWVITRLHKQRFYSLAALNNATADLPAALNKNRSRSATVDRTCSSRILIKRTYNLTADVFEIATHRALS